MSRATVRHPARRRIVAESCLIAADIDKTLLEQTDRERDAFLRHVAHHLVEAADLGFQLAFVTGNSMNQVTDRFLRWLIDHMCLTNTLPLLPQFHFLCSSGAAYFRFPRTDRALKRLLGPHRSCRAGLAGEIMDALTELSEDGSRRVRPRFVRADHFRRMQIPPADARAIATILGQCGRNYHRRVMRSLPALRRRYDPAVVSADGHGRAPDVELRRVVHGSGGRATRAAIVQLTLKPILSFRLGRTPRDRIGLFERDLRTDVVRAIQRRLDAAGLARYAARGAGRASIDVADRRLDKAAAMEFLIRHLRLRGDLRQGRLFGAHAIYLGDEVIVGGGNDYPVTRIPGLLVFAVNPDTRLVPFRSNVLLPGTALRGPEATAEIIGELNRVARQLLRGGGPAESAIDALKRSVFRDRIEHALHRVRSNPARWTPDEWQSLHAFVAAAGSDDAGLRGRIGTMARDLEPAKGMPDAGAMRKRGMRPCDSKANGRGWGK